GIRDRNVTGVQTCALPISPFDWFFFLILLLIHAEILEERFEMVVQSVNQQFPNVLSSYPYQQKLLPFSYKKHLDWIVHARLLLVQYSLTLTFLDSASVSHLYV